MTSDDDYITVLPDYVYNDVTPTAASKQHRNAVDDDDDEKSRDSPVTSPYEHPQPSEAEQQRQASTYQRVITSQPVPSNHLPPMTSDMTYDEIGDVPSPPPPRPG